MRTVFPGDRNAGTDPIESRSFGLASIRVLRGRGAVSSPQGRFEEDRRFDEGDGWPGGEADPDPVLTQVRAEVAQSIITSNQSPDIPFDRSINPYRGCEHGCVYCFARPTHSYLGWSPGLDFETRLIAKANAADLLRAELAAPSYRCEPLALGTATDAWQPIERQWRITRNVLEVLAQVRHPVTFVTKSSLVERDIDVLAPMARQGLVQAWVTISTLDADLARAWEPRAAAPWRRLEVIRKLAQAGIPVGVSISPLVPFLNEPELERIIAEAVRAGASSAFAMVLRLPWELREIFGDWLNAHYPLRAKRVLERIAEMRGGDGRLNDSRFHSRMSGEGVWAGLVGLRIEQARRRHRLAGERVELRTDLFVPPSLDGQLALF